MEEETYLEPSRNSALHKTMVISKRMPSGVRGGGGADADTPDCISEPILDSAETKLDGKVIASARGRIRSKTITLQQSETMDEFEKAFDQIQTSSLSDGEKILELRRKILGMLDLKEKEWNAHKYDENTDIGKELALAKLQTQIAKRAAAYADMFFKVCERNGINIEKVLRDDPEMIFNMKMKAAMPMPSEVSDTEIDSIRKERDNLAEETKGLKVSYSNLFRSYEKLRSNYDLLRETRNQMAENAEKQKEAMKEIVETAMDLKTAMLQHSAMADQTIAETKGKYDSSTVTIRMDLVKLQNENCSLRSEIEGKNREIAELRQMIQDVVMQANLKPADS